MRGSLFAGPGSTVSPGVFSSGTLTVTNSIVLEGTTAVDLDKTAGTNDLLRAGAGISYGGSLNVTVLSDPLGAGNSFKLFDAPSYSGAFTSTSPATPGAGLLWDTTNLTNNGSLKVVSATPLSPPRITDIGLSGADVVLSGANGPAYGSYVVLASTNVAVPLVDWTRLATNYFDGSGNFTFSATVDPNMPRRFYLLQLP